MCCGAGEQAQAACDQAAQRHADHAARALALSEGTGGATWAADARGEFAVAADVWSSCAAR